MTIFKNMFILTCLKLFILPTVMADVQLFRIIIITV